MKLLKIILSTISFALSCDIIFIRSSDLNASQDNLMALCQNSRIVALTSRNSTTYHFFDINYPIKYQCTGKNINGNKFLCSGEGKDCRNLYIGKINESGFIEYLLFNQDHTLTLICHGHLENLNILYTNPNNNQDVSMEIFEHGNLLYDIWHKLWVK